MGFPRALIALWVVCAAVIAWVWLRPLHNGPLPAPVTHTLRKKPRVVEGDPAAPVAQPEDEPAADEPTARPVQSGPPEMLNRHDLEYAMLKVQPKVLQCKDVEQFTGTMMVRLVVGKNGGVQSLTVLSPGEKTKTADCVKHALRSLSFPHFRGTYIPTIEWTYPFLFNG
jgi:outer membrane biosynthesis protein TonB